MRSYLFWWLIGFDPYIPQCHLNPENKKYTYIQVYNIYTKNKLYILNAKLERTYMYVHLYISCSFNFKLKTLITRKKAFLISILCKISIKIKRFLSWNSAKQWINKTRGCPFHILVFIAMKTFIIRFFPSYLL